MPRTYDVVAIVGSLRRESYTRRLLRTMATIAPPTLVIDIVDLSELVLYNQDSEAAPPAPWVEFRSRIKRADAVLFATPEYNRSVPAVLKNAVDVGSRPYGSSVWAKKPAAIVSTSPGALGGFGANQHLRQSLMCLDMPVLQQPEAYIAHVDKIIDASGQFVEASTGAFLRRFLDAFDAWIRKTLPA